MCDHSKESFLMAVFTLLLNKSSRYLFIYLFIHSFIHLIHLIILFILCSCFNLGNVGNQELNESSKMQFIVALNSYSYRVIVGGRRIFAE